MRLFDQPGQDDEQDVGLRRRPGIPFVIPYNEQDDEQRPRIARPGGNDRTPPLGFRRRPGLADIGFQQSLKGDDQKLRRVIGSLPEEMRPGQGTLLSESAAPRIARPNLNAQPALALRGVTPSTDNIAEMEAGANRLRADNTRALAKTAIEPSPLQKQTEADQAELKRLETSGSGISQIKNKWAKGGLRGLNIAGSIASAALPALGGVMRALPGTEEHHNLLVNRQRGRLGEDVGLQEKEAQAGEATARTAAIPVHSEWERAEAYRALHPTEQKDPVEQRRSFAEDHPDMFEDDHEENNFVLYGHEPKVATTNPNEWQLRLDAASGDEDAQAVLDKRFGEEKTLAGIRGRASADNRASREDDAADAEQIASTILNAAGGDPDKALKLFDQHSGKISDPDQRRLGPAIRKAIRARRQINKPQSALDKIISGDVEGGLTDMQSAPTQ